MKVIIPMAGFGKRLRPHTYSRPKPLINVAGAPMIKHVMDSLHGVEADEFIFIVGYLGDQIEAYIRENYKINASFYVQEEMIGQAHAIYLAKDKLSGPAIVLFADTLFKADLSIIKTTNADGVAFVKEVDDPRRFGVVEINTSGYITRFVEKPSSMENKLAVIGMYYLKDAYQMITAIETQMERHNMTKGEFYIADAFQIMVSDGAKFAIQSVDTWLDCGKPETVLETNRFLLENGHDNSSLVKQKNVTVIPPVNIHPDAEFEHAIIGPYATVAAGCKITYSIIRNSIIDTGATMDNSLLDQSLIGQDAHVGGRYRTLNVGDASSVGFS